MHATTTLAAAAAAALVLVNWLRTYGKLHKREKGEKGEKIIHNSIIGNSLLHLCLFVFVFVFVCVCVCFCLFLFVFVCVCLCLCLFFVPTFFYGGQSPLCRRHVTLNAVGGVLQGFTPVRIRDFPGFTMRPEN